MSTFYRRIVYVLLGAAGGLAAWPIMEAVISVQPRFPSYLTFTVASGALFGGAYGLFLGVADGVIAANGRRMVTGALFGAVWGLIGGALGFVAGQWLLFALTEVAGRRGILLDRTALPLARIVGWTVLGVFVGTTEGLRRWSSRKTATGLLGGFLGGALGGVVVEYSSNVLSAAVARPLGLVVFGLLLALAYGLVEKRLAFGVLRLLNGLYKGKEFVLNQRRIAVGSAVSADVPLPDYRRVEDRHAQLRVDRRELYLYPLSPGALVKRNDQNISEAGAGPLKYGDVVQFGNAKLLYLP